MTPRVGHRSADWDIAPPEEPPVPARPVARAGAAAPQAGLRAADSGRRRVVRSGVDRWRAVLDGASVVRPAAVRSEEAAAGPPVVRPVRLRASGPGAGPAAHSDAIRSAGRRAPGAPAGAETPAVAAPQVRNGSPRGGRRSPGGRAAAPVGCAVPAAGVRLPAGSSSAVAARVHAGCRRRLPCRYLRGTRCSARRSYQVPRAVAARVPTAPEGPDGQEHRRDVVQVVADERKNHRRSSCLLYRPGPVCLVSAVSQRTPRPCRAGRGVRSTTSVCARMRGEYHARPPTGGRCVPRTPSIFHGV